MTDYVSITVVFGVLLLISFLIILNLLRKLEAAQDANDELYDIYQEYWTFIVTMKKSVDDTWTRLDAIDRRGGFRSDDETGVIFTRIKSTIEDLNRFINGKESSHSEEEESAKE